tara:strand:- start:455 stop:1030 length:576 start_codon:yes stop_codon:yes gene_type:complete
MAIPSKVRAGDILQWRDSETQDVFGNAITSTDWSVTYYLRTNTANEAHITSSTPYLSGWQFTVASAVTANFDAGDWFFQAVADKSGAEKQTILSGQFEVLPSLVYSGSAAAFDGRSQIRKDLDQVQAAIRTVASGGGVKEYKIGTRQAKKYDLSELFQLEAKLKAELAREETKEKIANGLGNPRNLFVRFN